MVDPMEKNKRKMAADAAGITSRDRQLNTQRETNGPTRGIPSGGKVTPYHGIPSGGKVSNPYSGFEDYAGTYVTPINGANGQMTGYTLDIPDELGKDFYIPLTGGTQAAQDVAALVQEYRGLADQGLSATEYQALRDRAAAESAGAYQTAMRQTAQQQAAQNIRGGAAAGQQARLAQQYAMQEAQNAQELMIKDIEYKDKMRQDYGKQLATQLGIAESDAAKLLGGQVAGLGAETAIYTGEQTDAAWENLIQLIGEMDNGNVASSSNTVNYDQQSKIGTGGYWYNPDDGRYYSDDEMQRRMVDAGDYWASDWNNAYYNWQHMETLPDSAELSGEVPKPYNFWSNWGSEDID